MVSVVHLLDALKHQPMAKGGAIAGASIRKKQMGDKHPRLKSCALANPYPLIDRLFLERKTQ